jgi:DNA-binding MarR family transcriptional regulator
MNYDQLKLENQLCFPLYAASRLIIRAYQQDLDKLGITYPQYLVLMVMWEHEELTVNEIGEKLILNTNTVTPLLKRMETMGLLIRTQSKTDQRKILISLSEQGVNMQSKAAEIPANLMRKLNIKAGDAEIARALDLKNRLYDIINLVKQSEQTTIELV